MVSEKIPFNTNFTLILQMSAFFLQKSVFSDKNITFTQSNSMTAVLEIF